MTRLAELTIDSPQKMSKMGRHQVALWLEVSSRKLLKQAHLYSPHFKFSYFGGSRKRRVATVRIHDPATSLLELKRIVGWMQSRAKYLRQHGDLVSRRWFTQILNAPLPAPREKNVHETIHRPNPEPMRVAIP